MRKLAIALILVALSGELAHAGRGSSSGQIKSAIRSGSADAIISELERAERLICGACVEPVLALLDNADYRVREAAAWWIARRPAVQVEVRDLATARLYGVDSTQARNGADALGTFRNPEAIPALAFAASRADLSAEARAAAVQALGTIGHRDAATAIVGAMGDSDPLVRAAAVTAYGALRGPLTIEPGNLGVLAADPDLSVRRLATAMLGRYAMTSARDALIGALQNDADALVRRNAAWALGRIGDAAARPALENAAASDASAIVRSIAAAAISSLP